MFIWPDQTRPETWQFWSRRELHFSLLDERLSILVATCCYEAPPRSPQFWSPNTTNLVATRNKKRKKGNVYKLEFTPMFGQQYVSAKLTWLLCKFWVQTKIQIYYNTNIWRTVATKIAMLFRVIDLTQFCQFCAFLVCVICDIFNILLILKTAELITATLPK